MLCTGSFTFAQTNCMNRPAKVLLIIGAALAVGAITVLLREEKKTCDMLNKVADEGYETASDVLFPNTKKGNRKQHYGPVV
jgi:hypothetical protein